MTRSTRILFTTISMAALLGQMACGSSETPARQAESKATPVNAATSSDTGSASATGETPAEPATASDAERAPAFSLASHDGSSHSLESMLAKGPTVLVFYRGHW